MNPEKALIFDIQRGSCVDGPGSRTTVFFKGCNLRCSWCHNPESHAATPQLLFFEQKCTGCGRCRKVCPHALTSCDLCGACAKACPTGAREICGREYAVDELLAILERDKPFYEISGGGVTFSGGECMLQIDALEALLKGCRERGISTAVDTAGHLPYEFFLRILPYVDLFLYDVKTADPELHRRTTGVGNEQIQTNLLRLLAAGARVWVRIPVVPGVNDGEAEMKAIRRLLAATPPERIELLPYHAMGEYKYAALGRETSHLLPPTEEQMQFLRSVFS